MTFRSLLAVLVTGGAMAAAPPPAVRASDAGAQQTAAPRADDVTAVIKQAFRSAYNLDEKEALEAARRSVVIAPDDPAAHRALASIVWLDILFRRGAVVTDNYLSGSVKEQRALPKPPADLDAEFKRALGRAIELAERRVQRDPRSLQARYDVGTAYALQASYTATVEGSLMTAMRLAKRAYDAQEYVLSRDPRRVEAGLIVGTYRYLISTLSLPMRFMAYVVGFGGGKEKGIALVEAAARAPDTHVDAKVALLLMYNREGRFADAARMARELGEEFPKNRLFLLEQGSSATRGGQAADAVATLTRGIAMFDAETRTRLPGERAIWLYKRGLAHLALRHPADAHADFQAAQGAHPPDWLKGRLQLELGRTADLGGRRPEALGAYREARALCAARNDVKCASEAEQLMKRPFR